MAHIDLRLYWLAIPLDDGQQWLHAAGFPELGRIAATRKSAERALLRRIEAWLAREPARQVHNRVWPQAQLTKLAITLPPPLRLVEWRAPVQLDLEVLTGQRGDVWQACAPALGLTLAADSEDGLRAALVQQAQARLGKIDRARLRELAQLDRYRGASLAVAESPLELPSAKARAARRERVDASLLATLAERFPAMRAVGLEASVQGLADALGGDAAHSVLLVGPPGCGKTSAVAELARRQLLSAELLQTSGARLIAGQSGHGQWQQRLRELIRELAPGKAILHLGHLTELLEVGRFRAGEQSMAGFLRGDIARGTIRVVAECTPEQLAAIERNEPGLVAAFRTLTMAAPDAVGTRAILRAEAKALLADASDEVIGWIERLHRRHAVHSARPARAVGFLRDLVGLGTPLTPGAVTQAFAAQTGLPAWLLDEDQAFDRSAATRWFEARVLGQPAAIELLLDRIAEIKADLHRSDRPLGSFLLLGPTGTGKTELAKALAAFLFGSAERLTRFDLSQAGDPQSVQRLVGSSAWGAPEGQLTARIREQPFSVLLLDEFEKAHPSFFDLLLQMLGDGRLTDGSGRVADFGNTVVLLTSNLGAEAAQRTGIGFVAGAQDTGAHALAVKRFVRPELYNRFDAIVPFAPLGRDRIEAIAAREVALALARDGLRVRRVAVQLPQELIPRLAEQGFDPLLGARALKRRIEQDLVLPLAELLAARPDCSAVRWVDGRAEAAAPAARPPDLAPAQAAREFRQHCVRLRDCAAVQSLLDEAALLELGVQRLKRRKLGPTPAAAARLGLLRALDRDLATQLDNAREHEDAALVQLWDRQLQAPPPPPPLRELQALKRRVLAACHPQPQHFECLLLADVGAWFAELLGAYAQLGLQVRAVQVVERHGNGFRTRLASELAGHATLFAQPPATLIGASLVVDGELAAPLFAGELGVHLWRPPRESGAPRFALLRAMRADADFDPAEARSIAASALPRVREFDHERGELREGRARLPWDLGAPRSWIAVRMQERLRQRIDGIDRAQEPA